MSPDFELQHYAGGGSGNAFGGYGEAGRTHYIITEGCSGGYQIVVEKSDFKLTYKYGFAIKDVTWFNSVTLSVFKMVARNSYPDVIVSSSHEGNASISRYNFVPYQKD